MFQIRLDTESNRENDRFDFGRCRFRTECLRIDTSDATGDTDSDVEDADNDGNSDINPAMEDSLFDKMPVP